MKRKLGFLLTFFSIVLFSILAISLVVDAQVSLTAAGATCGTTGACLSVTVSPEQGGATFTISVNASGNTIQFEASGDNGVTWVSLSVFPSNSSTSTTSSASTGTWQTNVAAYTNIRMRMSTLVGGTTTVIINQSRASARAGGGGSGSSSSSIINSGTPIASGLVADWRFLEGSGTTVTDSSGNGNGLVFCATGPTWLTPGPSAPGPGVKFGGPTNNECITVPASMNAILGASGGATVQFLVYFDSALWQSPGPPNFTKQYLCLMCSNGGGANINTGGIGFFNLTGGLFTDDLTYEPMGFFTNGAGSSATIVADVNGAYQGTGVLTYVSAPTTGDLIYINAVQLAQQGNNCTQCFATYAPFSGNFKIGWPATGWAAGLHPDEPAMNLYRVLIYNRKLSLAEIQTNTEAIDYFQGQSSVISTMPCCMGSISTGLEYHLAGVNLDTLDQVVAFDDSVYEQNAPTWPTQLTLNGSTWSRILVPANGQTAAQWLSSVPYSSDTMLRPLGGKNFAFFCYGNDLPAVSAARLYSIFQTVGQRAEAAGWTMSFCTLPTRSGGGFDAAKDAFNILMRGACPNPVWCPVLMDMAADINTGIDGGGANATYFSDGTHFTATSLFNNTSIMYGRNVNRYYGNKNWATANTYTASGTNTIATTNATESGNIVTITVGATGPCVAGAEVFVTGVTPAGYNTPATQDGWYIRTSTATQITYYNFNTGLGAQSVAGTIHCAQQVDADDHMIINAAGATTIYLESCIGQSAPTYIMNQGGGVPTLTPWFAAQTINGAATMAMPVGSATNHPVAVLEPIFAGAVTAGCTWQAHIQ